MKLPPRHRSLPVVVLGVMVAIAVIVAGVRGSEQGAVLAGLVGGLLIAYNVRRHVRARLMYGRQQHATDDDAHPEATDRTPSAPMAHTGT